MRIFCKKHGDTPAKESSQKFYFKGTETEIVSRVCKECEKDRKEREFQEREIESFFKEI